MDEQSCSNCRFARLTESFLGLEMPVTRCRIRAPEAGLVANSGKEMIGVGWPIVRDGDWCGEWSAIGASAPATIAAPARPSNANRVQILETAIEPFLNVAAALAQVQPGLPVKQLVDPTTSPGRTIMFDLAKFEELVAAYQHGREIN